MKTVILHVRLTVEEKQALQNKADLAGVSMSTFIRDSVGLPPARKTGRPNKEYQRPSFWCRLKDTFTF